MVFFSNCSLSVGFRKLVNSVIFAASDIRKERCPLTFERKVWDVGIFFCCMSTIPMLVYFGKTNDHIVPFQAVENDVLSSWIGSFS